MFAIVLPAIVSTAYKPLIEIVTFDVLDSEFFQQRFSFDEKMQSDLRKSLRDSIADMGYETHNSIFNLGSVTIFIMMYLFSLIVLLGQYLFNRYTQKGEREFKYTYSTLIFSSLITILTEPYMELLISAYLNIISPVGTQSGDVTGFILGWAGMLVALMLPLANIWVIFNAQKNKDNKEFTLKWSKFYEDSKSNNKLQMLYFFIQIIRRAIFVWSVFQFDSGAIQIQFLLTVNLLVMIYIVQVKPLKS